MASRARARYSLCRKIAAASKVKYVLASVRPLPLWNHAFIVLSSASAPFPELFNYRFLGRRAELIGINRIGKSWRQV